jgi:LmbE family N-acetylglucosaminyl deacetylase
VDQEVSQITCHAGDRLMVFAPHPDDESLACGGLIQRAQAVGAPVLVVIATDGDANPWPQRLIEKRWHLGPDAARRWGALRGREARAALQSLGVGEDNARFLHWADQGLTKRLMDQGEASVAQLRQLIREHRPTLVAMPSILDSHPDHSALALMLKAALHAEGNSARLLSYWLHGRTVAAAEGMVSWLPLTPAELAAKRIAALCHVSQTRFGTSRLLRFVGASEEFRQPVARVADAQTTWRWHFKSRGMFGVAAARQIRIVAISEAGTLRAASFDLCEAIRSGHLRITHRGVRNIAVEMAPFWAGALWAVAKLDTTHYINVYDEFAWTASAGAPLLAKQAIAGSPHPSSPEVFREAVTVFGQQRSLGPSARD